jgi:hypothetical protein
MKKFDQQEAFNSATVDEALNPQHGEAFVDWAIEMLCFGETNDNIAILAGLREPLDGSEVMRYLHCAIQELGLDVTLLTAPEALWYGVQNVARRIVTGEITPKDGCEQLYRFYNDFEHGEFTYFSASLLNFLYLDEDYDFEAYGDLHRIVAKNHSREEIDRCVIEKANLLLNSPMPQKGEVVA